MHGAMYVLLVKKKKKKLGFDTGCLQLFSGNFKNAIFGLLKFNLR